MCFVMHCQLHIGIMIWKGFQKGVFEIKEFSERGSLKTILLAVCTRVLMRVEAFI